MKPLLKISIYPLDENGNRGVKMRCQSKENTIENFAVAQALGEALATVFTDEQIGILLNALIKHGGVTAEKSEAVRINVERIIKEAENK